MNGKVSHLRPTRAVLHRAISALTLVALVLSTVLAAVQPAQAAPLPAPAAAPVPLTIVEVSAPAINCKFDADCTITVADTASNFTMPGGAGNAFLQSRLWPVGEAGTPGAGAYPYLYRIDLRNVIAATAVACVTSMSIDFGPVTQLDYDGNGKPDDIFVVTKGGIGSVKPAAVAIDGGRISFQFDPAICAGGNGGGQSSFFFGLASAQGPSDVQARLTGTLGFDQQLAAKAPAGSPAPGCHELFSPTEIPSPTLVNFDDLPDAATIADHYQPTHGLTFYTGSDTNVITYADRRADPTKARSAPNVATNSAVFPLTSDGVPLTFWFDSGKTHVGFFMGNGETAGLAGAMVGYDAAGQVICQVTNPVPEPYTEFIGMHDPAGRIYRVTLNYSGAPPVLLSETIDDLFFAPEAGPSDPIFTNQDPVHIDIVKSDNTVFEANLLLPAVQIVRVTGPDQQEYQQALLPGAEFFGNPPGYPDVPMIHRLLAIPVGAEVVVEVARPSVDDEMTVLLYPAQPSALDGEPPKEFEDPPFTIDEKAYASDGPYPAEPVSIRRLGQMRDLELVQVSIAAGQYFPAKRHLKLFDQVALSIQFDGGKGFFLPKAAVENPFERSFDGLYAQVINQAAIYQHLGDILVSRPCLGTEFLIITPATLQDAADDLRTWKIAKGISTAVFETGNGAGQAGVTGAQIQSFIRNRYNNCWVRPSYLLLLGDTEFIPVFTQAFGGGWGTGAGDLPYALMTNTDETPDLAYGRIPADTLEQAQAVVDKVIAYEQNPPFNAAFYDNVAIASYFQCCRYEPAAAGNSGTDQRTFVETSELVRDGLMGEGYNVQRIYQRGGAQTPNRYYNGALLPVDLRSGSGFGWNGSTNDIVAAMNAGNVVMMHRGHGSTSGWADPAFSTAHLANVNNGSLTPVLYSINCSSGRFDLEPSQSWAEQMLLMAGEGAVGLIGDTRDSPTWANSALARGLFDATWTDVMGGVGGATPIRRLGDILNYAKTYMLGQVGQPGNGGGVVTEAARFDNYIYHVLGDPTLELWTSDPHQIWIPEFIEFYMPKPGEWVMGYHLDGATITALSEGAPVARGLVVNGQALLTQIGDGSVQRAAAPTSFVASYPNGVSQVLKVVEAQGAVTPEEGGAVQDEATGFMAEFPLGAAPGDVVVSFDYLDAPAHPLPGNLQGLFHFLLTADDEDGSPVNQFAQAFSLHIPVNLNGRAAVDPNSLLCQVYVDGQWQPFQGQYDAQTGSLVCQTTQLGEFAATATQPAGAGQNSIFLPVVTK